MSKLRKNALHGSDVHEMTTQLRAGIVKNSSVE
jgi:hypothetical protein